jgi:hypothetical protein
VLARVGNCRILSCTSDVVLTPAAAGLTSPPASSLPTPPLSPDPRAATPRRTGVLHLAPARDPLVCLLCCRRRRSVARQSPRGMAVAAALLSHRLARSGGGPRRPAREAVLQGASARGLHHQWGKGWAVRAGSNLGPNRPGEGFFLHTSSRPCSQVLLGKIRSMRSSGAAVPGLVVVASFSDEVGRPMVVI